MIHFLVGTCILMNHYNYRIVEVKQNVYLLQQSVTLFEETRSYKEYWKQSWINAHAKQVECKTKEEEK